VIILYSGSGSGGFKLLEPASGSGSFPRLKQHATALLNARGARRAATLLSQFQYSLWRATNDFGDEFCVLHGTLPLDGYEAARLQRESSEDRSAYARIAGVFSEIGSYVRFIAVSLDMSKQPVLNQHALKEAQVKKLVYKYIGVEGGYLGDFSYQSHADFYTEVDLDIDPYKYSGTTRERFIQILSEQSSDVQATILEGILQRFPVGSSPKRTQPLADEIRSWVRWLRSGQAVEHPSPKNATDTVRRALADSEHLIQKNGATSAVDRVHTALHGYQLGLCSELSIILPPDASLTQVFKCLRKQHPALQAEGPRSHDIERILNALNVILDAMNPIRNRASVAHPNEILLDETDARLAINASRTIFHYLDAKVSAWRTEPPTRASDDGVPF
jgi:hypothetical protein